MRSDGRRNQRRAYDLWQSDGHTVTRPANEDPLASRRAENRRRGAGPVKAHYGRAGQERCGRQIAAAARPARIRAPSTETSRKPSASEKLSAPTANGEKS